MSQSLPDPSARAPAEHRSPIVRPTLVMPPPGEVSAPMDERLIAQRTRRSFIKGAAATAAAAGAWYWLRNRPLDNQALWPLRRVLETNEHLARDYFSHARRAPEFAYGSAPPIARVNGDIGLSGGFDASSWRLQVSGLAEGSGQASLSIADIKALPRTQLTMLFCCVEGWSMRVNWAGAKFADFVRKYPPPTRSGQRANPDNPADFFDYVAMQTPDGGYYAGYDIASLLHPQTLLCYEIDDQPITWAHGAPLRLVIPNKYGVKNLKRIGQIRYTNVRPADYWAQRGYDWYCGI